MDRERILLLLREKKKLLLLTGVVLLGLTISFCFVLTKEKKDPLTKKDSFPSPTLTEPALIEEQPVTEVGDVIIWPEDLEYLANVYLPEKSMDELGVDEKRYLEDLALEKAIVIREAQKKGLTFVDSSLLAPDKNWEDYNKTYEKAKKAIISQEEQISAAGIFMYFYNETPPAMGVERAKELTREKMEDLKERLTKTEIDIKKAGEIIANDPALSEIDPIYDANAYSEFNDRNKTRHILGGITSQDNNLLWSLNVGDYSPIILGFESGNEVASNEAYWAIFQITSKKGTEKPYLEWLKEAKKKYASKNY